MFLKNTNWAPTKYGISSSVQITLESESSKLSLLFMWFIRRRFLFVFHSRKFSISFLFALLLESPQGWLSNQTVFPKLQFSSLIEMESNKKPWVIILNPKQLWMLQSISLGSLRLCRSSSCCALPLIHRRKQITRESVEHWGLSIFRLFLPRSAGDSLKILLDFSFLISKRISVFMKSLSFQAIQELSPEVLEVSHENQGWFIWSKTLLIHKLKKMASVMKTARERAKEARAGTRTPNLEVKSHTL